MNYSNKSVFGSSRQVYGLVSIVGRSTISTWTPYLDRAEPTGPILKGITYMVRPTEKTQKYKQSINAA